MVKSILLILVSGILILLGLFYWWGRRKPVTCDMLKKWLYPIFFVLLFLGTGQSFALENGVRGTKLVDSWKVLSDLGDDIPDIVRTNTKNLENISDHVNKGVHSSDDIATGLSKATDKQKWLDDLGSGVYRNGNKAEYVNPSGNVLSWTDQHPNSLDIQGSLPATGEAVTTGKQAEAVVADFVQKEGKEIEGFGLGVHNKTTNNTEGDIDVLTKNEIIVVKKSYSSFKKGQVNKFTDTSLPNYLNPNGRNAILYIHEPLSDLQKSSILGKIPNDVTLVNTLDELKSILQ